MSLVSKSNVFSVKKTQVLPHGQLSKPFPIPQIIFYVNVRSGQTFQMQSTGPRESELQLTRDDIPDVLVGMLPQTGFKVMQKCNDICQITRSQYLMASP